MKYPFFASILVLAIGVPLSLGVQFSSGHYDGKWWLSLESKEQLGFINGANNCRVWELRKKLRNPRPDAEEQSMITKYYKENNSNNEQAVINVLANVDNNLSSQAVPKGGEVWKEPHGYYDGQWWREAEGIERRGFLEGYLACYIKGTKQEKGKFSASPDHYLRLVNNWYGLREEDRSVNPKRVDTKIADVLFLFVERAGGTALPPKRLWVAHAFGF